MRFPTVSRIYQEQYAEPRTPEQLRAGQVLRLGALLRRILHSVPAFRALGVRCSPVADPFEVLDAMPLMSRERLLEDYSFHISDDLDPTRCTPADAPGPDGESLRVIHSEEHLVHAAAAELARLLADGVPFDRRTLLPLPAGAGRWREYTEVSSGFSRTAEFGLADGDSWPELLAVALRCREFQPDVLVGPLDRLVEFAELVHETGIELRVPVVRPFGERVIEPVRELFRTVFGGNVRHQYAITEVNTIAAECAAGNLHLDADRLWVEILDELGRPVPPGEPGEVTVTDFHNAAMPFVRYRAGDLAALQPATCDCGGSAPVLDLPGQSAVSDR